MKINEIEIGYGETIGDGNYGSTRLWASYKATLEPGESREEAERELWQIAKASVDAQLEDAPADAEASESARRPPPPDPRPKTLGDLATPKQLWMLRNLAREREINAEKECITVFQCNLEEISKKAASYLIDHFKTIGVDAPTQP